MNALKTKWVKNGVEIDAFVHIQEIIVSKGRMPSVMGGGSPTPEPPTYGSMISYVVAEDEEGTIILSRGQSTQPFDIDGTASVKDFAKNTLGNLAHFADMTEV